MGENITEWHVDESVTYVKFNESLIFVVVWTTTVSSIERGRLQTDES